MPRMAGLCVPGLVHFLCFSGLEMSSGLRLREGLGLVGDLAALA